MTPEQVNKVLSSKTLSIAFQLLRAVSRGGPSGMICEEALKEVGISYQVGSKPFFDLAAVGCILPKAKRPTTSGALAVSYIVPDGVQFLPFLALHKGTRGRAATGLSPVERHALAAAMHFVGIWHRTQTNAQREHAVSKLVKSLAALTHNTVRTEKVI